VQAANRGYDRLPQFGAAGSHGLARGEQERLLMKLRVMGLLQDDTQRQEQHGSIISVLSLHQVNREAACICTAGHLGMGSSIAGLHRQRAVAAPGDWGGGIMWIKSPYA
jgi:hypothetical protein